MIEGDNDHVVGIVHIKDAMSVPHERRDRVPVRALMAEPVFVPSSVGLDSLLAALQGGGPQMAVVVDAVLIAIALWVIGVPLVLALAVLTFLGAFVPLAGAVLAGAVAALVALVTEGALAAILVVVVITVIQQLEGDVLYPLVVGRSIALHPVAILLALTAGTVLAGLVGALLAVPLTAMAWDALEYLRSHSRAYSGPNQPPA